MVDTYIVRYRFFTVLLACLKRDHLGFNNIRDYIRTVGLFNIVHFVDSQKELSFAEAGAFPLAFSQEILYNDRSFQQAALLTIARPFVTAAPTHNEAQKN